MLLHGTFERDSRVEREARSLVARGHEVEVVCLLARGFERRESRDGYSIRRVSPHAVMSRRAGRLWRSDRARALREIGRRAHWFLRWRTFLRRAARAAAERPAGLVLAHDLDALPAGVRARRRLGAPLAYDSHELFADLATASRSRLERRAYIAYERLLRRRADLVFAVSDSQAAEMERRFGSPRPQVLRNVPEASGEAKGPPLRELLELEKARPLVVYIGNLQPSRGLEQLIRAMAMLDGHTLALIGAGEEDYVAELRDLAAGEGVGDDVRMLAPVLPREMVTAVAGADVGVVATRNVSLNNYLSLPNKIFVYAAAGVPVAATDLPDISALLAEHGFGVTFDPESPEDIARAIREITGDPARGKQLRRAAQAAGRELTWERESAAFVEAIERLAR